MTEVLETENLRKEYGNIIAINNVNYSVAGGKINALVGDNGAGKSTLIRMLSGVTTPTSGTIRINDQEVTLEDHTDARENGIETVYQELALVPKQTVVDNIFLGQEISRDGLLSMFSVLDRSTMYEECRSALERLDMSFDPESTVSELSGGQQQAVAIARALQSDPDILILDEPTSALSIEGSRKVLDLLLKLKERGLTIVLISHNIQEVMKVADRISVLFNGELLASKHADETTEEQIISYMMGSQDESGMGVPA